MRAFVFYILLISQVTFAAFSSNWYTEDAYLSRENILSSLIRVRGEYKVTDFLSPYVTAGSDLQTQTDYYSKISNSSYAYAGPGFKVELLGVQLYSELRGLNYYQVTPNQKNLDARILLVMGKYGDFAMDASRSILSFYELYSETIFSTLDESNLIESAYLRAGLRKPVLKELMVDTYLEPFLTLDRVGHFYNNRADLKVNLRVLYSNLNYSFGLTASYLLNQYFDYAKFERNPYQNENAGFRFLFTAGGTF